MARKWGVSQKLVGLEMVEAQKELEASRTPDAAMALAHELIVQSIETAEKIDQDATFIVDEVDRARTRATAATIKLKAAAELRQLYRKSGSLADTLAAMAGGPPALGSLKGDGSS